MVNAETKPERIDNVQKQDTKSVTDPIKEIVARDWKQDYKVHVLNFSAMFSTVSDSPRGATQPRASVFQQALDLTAKHKSAARLSPLIAQWEVLITVFKSTFEIPRLLGSGDEAQHRTVLTGLMAMGETVWTQVKDLDEPAMEKATGYSKDFVKSNLEYLREKYEDWYFPKDAGQIESDWKLIQGELNASVG